MGAAALTASKLDVVVAASAKDRGLEIPRAEGFRAIPGHGVEAQVDGRMLHVGGPNLLERLGVEERRALAAISTADAVRPESREAVRRLQEAGSRS